MKRRIMYAVALAVALSLLFGSNGFAADGPKGIVLTWAEDDVYRSMAVSWFTTDEDDSVVYFDTKKHDNVQDYAFKAQGKKTKVRAGDDVIFKNWYHAAQFKDLKPATTFYFICGGPKGWSEVRQFRTMDPSKDVRFAFFGDTRCRNVNRGPYYEIEGPAYPEARIAVAKAIAAKNPDFAVFGGDMIMSGHDEEDWAAWFRDVTDNLISPDGSTIPLVPTLGNHDLARYRIPGKDFDATDETDYHIYTGLFALPGNGLWYTLNFKDLRLVSLLSAGGVKKKGLSTAERVAREMELQVPYLKQQLETNDKKWLIPFTHYSVNGGYGIKPGDGGWGMMESWVPLFEKYRVPLVLTSHSHNFMRSWPLKKFAIGKDFVDFGKDLELWPKGPPTYDMATDSRDGVTYIVQGSAGATQWYEEGTAIRIYPWMAAAFSRPSFTLVEIQGDKCRVLTEQAGTTYKEDHKRPRGAVLDDVTLPYVTKDFPPAKYNVAF
jgi:hypothetical protein